VSPARLDTGGRKHRANQASTRLARRSLGTPGMGLDGFAKRYSSLILCVMLAVAAYFQAAGVGRLLVATVLAGTAAPSLPFHTRAPAPGGGEGLHATSAAAILGRNPFDSVTGPIPDGERGSVTLPEVARAERDPYADPPCDMARVVLITSADDPDWSFAAITGRDGKTALHRKGDAVDGHTVLFIGRQEGGSDDRVWLASGAGRCQLALGAKIATVGKPAQAAAPASDLASKVRKIGEHQFEIDRTTVDALLANPAELMKTRVVPDREGERVVGVRLFNIRPGSMLGALGLENGDRLSSINGFEMNEPQKMLEAYSKLTTASKLSVSIVRNGQPIGLDVDIK
jgi:general secretion pathway protein C